MSDGEKEENTDPLLRTFGESAPSEHPAAMTSKGQAVKAWREMAGHMVAVVRSIEKNERRMRVAFYSIVACAMFFTAVNITIIVIAEQREAARFADLVKRLNTLDDQTKKVLGAVTAGSRAVALKIEADTTYDPETEKKAAEAAIEAEKKSLEAKKAIEVEPAEKKKVERHIKQAEKRAKKIREDAAQDSGE